MHTYVPLEKIVQNWIVDRSNASDFTVPRQQIKLHPTSWQYTLINYFEQRSTFLNVLEKTGAKLMT